MKTPFKYIVTNLNSEENASESLQYCYSIVDIGGLLTLYLLSLFTEWKDSNLKRLFLEKLAIKY